jgi:hypothetical protein
MYFYNEKYAWFFHRLVSMPPNQQNNACIIIIIIIITWTMCERNKIAKAARELFGGCFWIIGLDRYPAGYK